MLSRPVVLLAAVFASPALYAGLVAGTLDVDKALLRFLVAVPVCAVMVAVVKGLVGAFRPAEGEVVATPQRRAGDSARRSAASGS